MPMSADTSAMRRDLEALKRKIRQATPKAVKRFGVVEMRESQKLVPVDKGDLKATGTVHEPKWNGDTCTVALTYGSSEVDYAVHVHEDLEAFHQVGQAKYLEQPLKESAPHFLPRVAADIAKDVGM